MLSSALKTATPAMASASQVTRSRSPLRMPSSTIRCTSSGMTTTMAASITVITRNAAIRALWGPANRNTRPTVRRSMRLLTTERSERR